MDKIQTNIRSLPNNNKVSNNMKETLGVLIVSLNSLNIIQDNLGGASIVEIPIFTLGGDRLEVNDGIYDLTPEVYKIYRLLHTPVKI